MTRKIKLGDVSSKAKILFVGPFPPPLGGIANHTMLLFESELNDEFELIKLNLNLPWEKTEIVSTGKRINLYKIYNGLRMLLLILHSRKPKAIYIKMNGDRSCFREMLYMAVIRTFFKARIILHFHGMFKEYRRNFPFIIQQKYRWLNRFIINACFSLSHRTIFLSESILRDFQSIMSERNKKKSSVIEHFIDSSFFSCKKKNNNKTNILYMGRLSREKGFFETMRILQDVVSVKSNVVFHFCGLPETENEFNEIRQVLNNFEKSGFIKFYGEVTGERKRRIYSEADILIFPSHNEVFPNTILEGLAQGLPIVTTKVGVIPDVIQEKENGLFVEIGNPDDIRNKLLYLLNNPELQRKMSINNRKKAKERFDISIAVRKLKSIFNDEIAAAGNNFIN